MNVAAARAALGKGPSSPAPADARPNVIPLRAEAITGQQMDPAVEVKPGTATMSAEQWAPYASEIIATAVVTARAENLVKKNLRPRYPDASDLRRFDMALQEGIRIRFGDTGAPWWFAAGLALTGIWVGMGRGATPLGPVDPDALVPQQPQQQAPVQQQTPAPAPQHQQPPPAAAAPSQQSGPRLAYSSAPPIPVTEPATSGS